jgi:hypothetical protein
MPTALSEVVVSTPLPSMRLTTASAPSSVISSPSILA